MASRLDRYDVIVVGFGGAGAAAAIEAADGGAKVLAIDRAHGGGATALSGGVVYAGGGTRYQEEAGCHDSPENMFAYLEREVGDAVSEETLRRFCEESPAMVTWLEEQGVEFEGSLVPYKTSYPTDSHYLYYSGSEMAWPYVQYADPAPRGHRTLAKGLGSGLTLYEHLKASALAKGVTFQALTRAEELIVEDLRVVGVRLRQIRADAARARHEALIDRHRRLTRRGNKLGNWFPWLGTILTRRAETIWDSAAIAGEARAKAVILAAGGFVFNREWMERWSGPYQDIRPLGTVGDDGSGIELGVAAGGSTRYMDHFTAWRFLTPPSAFLEGIAVGVDGRRICNEDLYGAALTDELVRMCGGKGRAIFDSRQWRKARAQLSDQANAFQGLQAYYLFSRFGHKRAQTIELLAGKTGIDPTGLRSSVDAYNAGIAGDGDPAHKARELCSPIVEPPFYAIDISIKNRPSFPVSGLSLGGLDVDELTGSVLNSGKEPIPGLYAAGRTAVGLCSNGYLSGLSISDCIFSGRRAGQHATKDAIR